MPACSDLLRSALALLATVLLAACGGGGGGGTSGAAPAYQPNALFGNGGVVTGQGTETNTRYMRADVLGDGSMAVLGTTDAGSGTFATLLIEKRLPDGTPDTSFGGNGQVEFGAPEYTPKAVALSPQDGSVVVAADHSSVGYTILKFKANGSPDAAFGVNGVREVTMQTYTKLAGMVVENDGRVVVAGYSNGLPFVMRFTANGAPDPTWNGGLPYTFQIFGSKSYIMALCRRSGGGYLVAGRTFEPGDDNKLIVGAFGTNGLPVPSFGSAGFLIYTPPFSLEPSGIVARPGGGGVVFGMRGSSTAFALGVSATGGIEQAFGYQELPAAVQSPRGATQRASDGHITLGFTDGYNDLLLWRVREDGSSDPGFGVDGVSVFPIPQGQAIARIEPHILGGFLAVGHQVLNPGQAGIVLHLVE